jgi:acetyl-CoA carboxylase biotin carboxylase subunit
MIAKLIVTAATRDAAIRRMRRALGEFMIQGIKTTIPLQSKILTTADFQQGKYDITWVENFLRQEGMKDKG